MTQVPCVADSAGKTIAFVPVADLTAGDVIVQGKLAVTDGAGNAIASKTLNTAAQPSTTAINDFGALDATHKALTAGETVSLAITNGTTAATPAGQLVIRYIPTNA